MQRLINNCFKGRKKVEEKECRRHGGGRVLEGPNISMRFPLPADLTYYG